MRAKPDVNDGAICDLSILGAGENPKRKWQPVTCGIVMALHRATIGRDSLPTQHPTLR